MGLTAYYGDLTTPRIFAIDVATMTRVVEHDIPINAPAYPVDAVGKNLLYGITRGEQSVTPIDTTRHKAGKPIPLSHKPRSTATRKVGQSTLCLIAGADQPVTSVVDVATSRVLQVVGQPTFETDTDYGGTLASGHPIWIDRNNFLLLDRRHRTIAVYELGQSLPLWTMRTPTSCHHVHAYGSGYVAMCEGNPDSLIPPSLTFFEIDKRRPSCSSVTDVVFMPSATGGAHHLEILGDSVYVPTSDGMVYVVQPGKKGFVVAKSFKAGSGAGHVVFNEGKLGVGVIVNHTETYVTLFDQKKHTAITNVQVASEPPAGKKSQAHTSKIIRNGKYFYGAASQDGEFYRIDLTKRCKDQTLDLDTYGAKATPLQGVFV